MNWKLFFILCGCGILSYIAYYFLFKRQILKLTSLLYHENNPDGFLKELNSLMSRFFFPKKMHAMMSIDAYLMKSDNEKLKELFKEIDNYRLRAGDEFYVRQKEIVFYVEQNDEKNAEHAYTRMKEIYDGFKDKSTYEGVMKESEYVYEINLKQNPKYLDEMLAQAKHSKNEFMSGIYLYRAAKCYYFKNDNKNCKATLEKAKVKLKGSFYEKIIDDILNKDISIITTK